MTAKKPPAPSAPREVERIQTGVRLEKRLLKVLKGLAEYLDLSLGDLLEGIALHALENKPPFKRLTLEKSRSCAASTASTSSPRTAIVFATRMAAGLT